MAGVLTRKGYSDTDRNRGRVLWRHRKMMGICRPRTQSCCHRDLGLPSVSVGNSFLKFNPPNLWYFVRAALENFLLWMWESSHFLEFDRRCIFFARISPYGNACWHDFFGPELTLAGLTSCHHGGEPGPNYSTQVLTFIPHSFIFSSKQRFMDFCCHWSWWLLYQRTSAPVLGEWLS